MSDLGCFAVWVLICRARCLTSTKQWIDHAREPRNPCSNDSIIPYLEGNHLVEEVDAVRDCCKYGGYVAGTDNGSDSVVCNETGLMDKFENAVKGGPQVRRRCIYVHMSTQYAGRCACVKDPSFAGE